jgi:hypothetical protein
LYGLSPLKDFHAPFIPQQYVISTLRSWLYAFNDTSFFAVQSKDLIKLPFFPHQLQGNTPHSNPMLPPYILPEVKTFCLAQCLLAPSSEAFQSLGPQQHNAALDQSCRHSLHRQYWKCSGFHHNG